MACLSRGNDGEEEAPNATNRIKGTVVLMTKNFLDMPDLKASLLDRISELFGRGVTFRLISSNQTDQGYRSRGKVGKAAKLENFGRKKLSLAAEDASFSVNFDWDESFGVPQAFLIKNHHYTRFYLKSVTLDVPASRQVHFVCNSWVYPARRYKYNRIFFSNKAYLPHQTPQPLKYYREEELQNLRGNGRNGKLKEWDRVYDYAYYNDLGSPEKGQEDARPVLGGSQDYPYPRRGKTGRRPNREDPYSESRLPLLSLSIYVPCDERFNHIKFSDFLAYGLKSIVQVIVPEVASIFDETPDEFDSFGDVMNLYERGVKLPEGKALDRLRACIPWEMFRELLRNDGERFLKLPMPDVIKENKTAWRTDEEFGREMLAGLNPVIIQRLRDFPPISNLDPKIFGSQHSSITKDQMEKNMNGLTVDDALRKNRLFILDHHDALMPYLRRINSTTKKVYATRTVLLLQDDGTLKPLAIELSLPHPEGDLNGAVSTVFTPEHEGVRGSVWQLAKAYVAVNDSGYHQLISHWLSTHAVIEPFVIATHRQLSVVHPIYKLLHPHFRDTMHINALARQILINAGGVLERTVFPGEYAMEMSSVIYKNWVFTNQGLPADLLKRGVAVEDSKSPHGLRLLIEDYPYAVDGLEIWSAIKTWVTDYSSFYYEDDNTVGDDAELQAWWDEIRTEGHGDLKDKPWWPSMKSRAELIGTIATIIWVASALHAAVNFGQYPYAGYLPNRPTLSRRLMPEPGTNDYADLEKDPDLTFLKTITPQLQTLLGVSLLEALSMHSTDEVYLGQRESEQWTQDNEALAAFERFASKLVEIENLIEERNRDESLKNRIGPVKLPYTLLYPNASNYSKDGGLIGKGIPNSISI